MFDEIIEEVLAIKENLAAQSDFDIRRIAEEIRKSEVVSAAEGWSHVTERMPKQKNLGELNHV